MESFWSIGKKYYRVNSIRGLHRFLVFLVRANLHRKKMRCLGAFFQKNALRREIAAAYPYVYEQPTRAFFYKGSTFDERVTLLIEHMSYLEEKLRPKVLQQIYHFNPIILLETEQDGSLLRLILHFHVGQRKEGLLALTLLWGAVALYQMIFWIAKDKTGAWALWIGAMQGPNIADSRGVIKKLTKACHGCRTKNLILHVTQEVARALGVEHIYAVTNDGYYAMNHVRKDRKLKTNFGDFWKESGGVQCADARFYELPLKEHRRSMEEVPTRKRAVYRRRYAMFDEIDTVIAQKMKESMN